MKNMKMYLLLVLILCFGSAISIAQTGDWGNPETGIIMQYHQPQGTLNNYRFISNSTMEMDMSGQSMGMTVITQSEALHKISKIEKEKITHELSFTSYSVDTQSDVPQMGNMEINTDLLLNKPLMLTTGKRGENPNPTNVDKLPTATDMGVEPPPAMGLMVIVPELADRPVKIKDKWTTTTTLDYNFQGNKSETTVETEYTFIGMEKKRGFDCMKITGVAKIKSTSKVSMMGMDAEADGEAKSKITAFFAYKEGIFIEIVAETDGDTAMDIPSAGMTMGMTISDSSKLTYVNKDK